MLGLRRAAVKSVSAFAARTARVVAVPARTAMYYTKDHEYINLDAGATVGTVGISNYAQEQLGDIVYCDVQAAGTALNAGESFGAVESTKSASDVYMPVEGTILEANERVVEDPSIVNSSAQTDGWLAKVEVANPEEVSKLMDQAAYDAYIATLDH